MYRPTRKEELLLWRRLLRAFLSLIHKVQKAKSIPQILRAVSSFTMSPAMQDYVDHSIDKMVTHRRVDSATTWKQAAIEGGKGKEIAQALRHEMQGPVGSRVQQIVQENSRYIKTLPQEWAERASNYALEQSQAGKRPEQIEKELREMIPQTVSGNLKTIARTETAKANSALQKARAESLGIKCYFWRDCSDQRTRHSHHMMNGVLVFYDDPPDPEALFPDKNSRSYGHYHAGDTFNCRCYQEPVIGLQYLPDTMKVCNGGKVTTMTKAAVIKLCEGK